jgi:SIR2-like domain
MPDWGALGDEIAQELPGYEPQNAVDAISAYAENYGRSRLVERMNELLHIGVARPGAAHEALCRAGFDLILTTNFDYLIEQAYAAIGHPCRPLLIESQLSQRPLDDQAQLLKLHGDLNHPDQLVATEDDYDGFLQRSPLMATFTANLLITRTPLLLGYSFDDPDTRSLWALIKDRLGTLRRQGYVIKLNATPTESARFGRRGIKLISLPGDDYDTTFAQLFDELRDMYIARVGQVSAPTEDEVAAELALPPEIPSRLCFCSVPVGLIGWYRNEIFPVIEEAGYVTVTRDEIVAPGANVGATVDALLARAQLALVDGGSFTTAFELQMALAALPSGQVIVVMDSTQALPPDVRSQPMLNSFDILRRDDETIAHPEQLAAAIRARLAVLGRRTSEPVQLLQQGHINAAVIVAFGLLEDALQKRLGLPHSERPPGLMRLIQAAADAALVTPEERQRFGQWVGLRNVVVHGRQDADPEAAKGAVADINRVLRRLRDERS